MHVAHKTENAPLDLEMSEKAVTKALNTEMPDAPDAKPVTQVIVDGKAVRVYGLPLRILREQPGMLDAPEIVVPGLAAIVIGLAAALRSTRAR